MKQDSPADGADPTMRPTLDSSSTAPGDRSPDRASEPELSIVIPVFDEEPNVEPLCLELMEALQAVTDSYEVIFVDDGSRDGTLDRLRVIAARHSNVKVLRFGRNFGQSAAIQAGFDAAVGRVVVTMDGDLQNDPADIGLLLKKLEEGYDVVSGWRQVRQDLLLTRRIPSQAANWLIAKVTRVPIHDNGCALKAYRQRTVKKARLYAEMHRFLVPMLSLSGSRVAEIPVNHRKRRFGATKYGLSRIWKVLLDLITVKMLLRFSSYPTAWFAVLALPFAAAAVISAGVSVLFYAVGTFEGEIPIVILSVSLLATFAAVHLILLGMLAEVVVRVGDYRESQTIIFDVETVGGTTR